MAIALGALIPVATGVRATPSAPAPKPTPSPKPTVRSAPGDEYFGLTKMSIFGVHNKIHDLTLIAGYHSEPAPQIFGDALFIENAITAWHAKFPNDPSLPGAAFRLERLYELLEGREAQQHANAMLHFIVQNFPRTYAAHVSRLELAAGGAALVTPTPSPSPSPSPEPTDTPTPEPTPSPSPTPDRKHKSGRATPTPAATPSPAPTPSDTPTPEPTASPTPPGPRGKRENSTARADVAQLVEQLFRK